MSIFKEGMKMNENYESTRNQFVSATGKQAVLKGIAPDGGLYVRRDLDSLQVDLDRVLNSSYKENAAYILGLLFDDYTAAEIQAACENAYTDTFAHERTVPVKSVGDVEVLELFHGPTSAFKDVALTMLPQLMAAALKDTNEKALILTATSGDTGKAALCGFADVKDTGIAVFYPHGKVSDVQYRQMATQKGDNVKVFAVKGNFDDAQSAVKNLFLDEALNKEAAARGIRLTSANSINIGRLAPQVVYYFDAWKQLVNDGKITRDQKVSFSVPTGNFGDVLAGYYAYLMGLPVEKFIVASNANNVLSDFLTTGVYDRNREFVKTISPSMDILISSNLERLLYYMSGKDNEKVKGWMDELASTGRYQVDEKTLAAIQQLFICAWNDDGQTRATIKDVYEKTGYVLDPHSAIGYKAAAESGLRPVVSLATASPYKFAQDVLQAVNGSDWAPWQALHELEKINAQPMPEPLKEVETAPIRHDAVIEVKDMEQAVKDAWEACL